MKSLKNSGYRNVCLSLMLCLCACTAIAPPPTTEPAPVAECRAIFDELDRAIARAGARDHGPTRITGFPFLRANRLLASFAAELASEDQFEAWIGHLARLDAQTRALETLNFPGHANPAEMDACRDLLIANLLTDSEQQRQLLDAVKVPDDYVTAWRIAGLYPLTSQFVAMGVRREQGETAEVFAQPLESLPVTGQLQRWGGPAIEGEPEVNYALDPIGIPILTKTQVDALFQRHAPIWEVDVADDNDRIGTAVWRNDPGLDTSMATQYQTLSHTRFGEHVLLQLNYVIWFAARPGNDILAGRLDGLIWRVTLGPDGEPWLYDSIHNCGCYHTFIPTQHLRLRSDLPVSGFEPPLVPQRAPAPPLVVRVASGTHYLQRVYSATEAGTSSSKNTALSAQQLAVSDYDHLRALPSSQGHTSFFGEFGLVDGSERAERFILWPMGVRSPGAMRQWGHHPVAFVGRRHFDDARMVESLFVRTQP